MSRFNRISNIVAGVVLIAMAAVISFSPEEGYLWIIMIIGATLIFSAVKDMWFFITMARFMVGGKFILYRSIILLQFGFFTWSLNDVPKVYVILYLAIVHAFTGLVDILDARESIMYKAPDYKKELFEGCFNLVIAVLCLIFIKYIRTAVWIYSSGLVWSGRVRIKKAVEKQEMVYIK